MWKFISLSVWTALFGVAVVKRNWVEFGIALVLIVFNAYRLANELDM